jgi:hypothetical protein
MQKSLLEVLDADEQVEKRAQWEAFSFRLLGDGDVEVTNGSHENPDNHTYTVHVEGGIPSDCTCPAWEYQSGACKHMVAVAIREPVLDAASEDQPVRADRELRPSTRSVPTTATTTVPRIATVARTSRDLPAGRATGTASRNQTHTQRERANDPAIRGSYEVSRLL